MTENRCSNLITFSSSWWSNVILICFSLFQYFGFVGAYNEALRFVCHLVERITCSELFDRRTVPVALSSSGIWWPTMLRAIMRCTLYCLLYCLSSVLNSILLSLLYRILPSLMRFILYSVLYYTFPFVLYGILSLALCSILPSLFRFRTTIRWTLV